MILIDLVFITFRLKIKIVSLDFFFQVFNQNKQTVSLLHHRSTFTNHSFYAVE